MKPMLELKLIRKNRNLTRDELSEKSGVNKFTIQALEEGRNEDVKLSTLLALSQALRVKVRKILPIDIASKL